MGRYILTGLEDFQRRRRLLNTVRPIISTVGGFFMEKLFNVTPALNTRFRPYPLLTQFVTV